MNSTHIRILTIAAVAGVLIAVSPARSFAAGATTEQEAVLQLQEQQQRNEAAIEQLRQQQQETQAELQRLQQPANGSAGNGSAWIDCTKGENGALAECTGRK